LDNLKRLAAAAGLVAASTLGTLVATGAPASATSLGWCDDLNLTRTQAFYDCAANGPNNEVRVAAICTKAGHSNVTSWSPWTHANTEITLGAACPGGYEAADGTFAWK
jgi:hypothetical protein